MPEEQEKQPTSASSAEPKIIVDEDWKQQAQREKEVLAAKEEQEKEKAQHVQRPTGKLPKGDFAALVSMLTTQALFAMGLLQVKGQPERKPDLELARYNIDILETIEEKTKGNLTKAEEKVLTNTLNDLRMGYVEVANALGSES